MSESTDILMPKLGLTMTEGRITEWLVKEGDIVSKGDVIFIVETEKVAVEVESQRDGTLQQILVQQGDTVDVGTVVAQWEGAAAAKSAPSQTTVEPVPTESSKQVDVMQPSVTVSKNTVNHGRIIATPLARKLAYEANTDLSNVTGTGPGGRIKAGDVRQFLKAKPVVSTTSASQTPNQIAVNQSDDVLIRPASSFESAMAQRMVESKRAVPHFYLFGEAEVSELLALRKKLNRSDSGPKLTINHFLVTAMVQALIACPEQNRIWQNGNIVQFNNIDIGVAVSTDNGLLAPVVKNLGNDSLDAIAAKLNQAVEQTRAGKLMPDDMSGGAITISNAGMFNVSYMASIINPPQSAILGAASVRDVFRPDADGNPELRRELGLVLTCDHRVHDGAGGLKFLNTLISLLENPYSLLRNLRV